MAAVAVAGAETLLNSGTSGSTETVTKSSTVTSTVQGGGTSTVTVTSPPATVTSTVTSIQTTAPGTSSIITLNVNGVSRTTSVDNRWSLADTLRYKFNLIGTKVGCDRGECG